MGIPRRLYERHKSVTLTVDMMFMNGISFLATLSRGIILFTCEHVPSRKAAQLSSSLRKVVNVYGRGGFTVCTILMDMEFKKVNEQDGMGLLDINTTATREHVGEIEQDIRYLTKPTICVVRILSVVGIHNLLR